MDGKYAFGFQVRIAGVWYWRTLLISAPNLEEAQQKAWKALDAFKERHGYEVQTVNWKK